jgi:hypothetical protein
VELILSAGEYILTGMIYFSGLKLLFSQVLSLLAKRSAVSYENVLPCSKEQSMANKISRFFFNSR